MLAVIAEACAPVTLVAAMPSASIVDLVGITPARGIVTETSPEPSSGASVIEPLAVFNFILIINPYNCFCAVQVSIVKSLLVGRVKTTPLLITKLLPVK